jgi:hypothetical protein
MDWREVYEEGALDKFYGTISALARETQEEPHSG